MSSGSARSLSLDPTDRALRCQRSDRRPRWTTFAWVIASIASLLVVAMPPVALGQGAGGVVLFATAPYQGAGSGALAPTCGSNLTVARSPFFALGSGRLGVAYAIGSPGADCDVVAEISFHTGVFCSSFSGAHTLTSNWWLAWRMNGTVRTALAGFPASDSFQFEIDQVLIDHSNGSQQAFDGVYLTQSSVGKNGTFAAAFDSAIRFADTVELHAGDTYSVQIDVSAEMIADASLLTTDFAYGEVAFGRGGHPSVLRDVSIV